MLTPAAGLMDGLMDLVVGQAMRGNGPSGGQVVGVAHQGGAWDLRDPDGLSPGLSGPRGVAERLPVGDSEMEDP